MNGYYKIIVQIISQYGYCRTSLGKGSHEVWVRKDESGKIIGRIQIPHHLNDPRFANMLLKEAGIPEKVN